MENTNLLNYSKQLAIKLRDPVDSGGSDGEVFHAEYRFGYLTRGFGKLIRNLESIGYDVEYIYPQFYNILDRYFQPTEGSTQWLLTDDGTTSPLVEQTLDGLQISLNELITAIPVFQPYKIIAKGTAGNNAPAIYRGRPTKISNAFEALHGLSTEHYDKTKLTDSFFFYIANGKINIVGPSKKITSLHFLLRNPLPHFASDSGSDLVIPTEFEDLFLSLAALEAVTDTGKQDRVALYRGEISNEIQLLGVGQKVKDSKETTDPIR